MTYWNPIERYGVERFAADLAAAGGAGLITPDLIPDEAERRGSPRATRTASTGSSWSRRRRPTRGSRSTAAACRGFVYAASTMGVTGARATVDGDAPRTGRRTGCAPSPTCRSASASACRRRPGRRGRRLRRRRDRRLGPGAPR